MSRWWMGRWGVRDNQEKLYSLFPFLLVFYEITNYLANDMYLPALPHLAADLSIPTHLAQQTLTAWFLGTTSLQLILGPFSDRFGRRLVLLGGGVVFIISTIICALTANIQVLLTARFFQGCAICTIGTAGYSSIHEIFDRIKAIKILAVMGSITVLAPAFGPLLGAVLLQWLNWRWIFGVLAIWAIVGVSLLWLFMPESNPKEKRQAFDGRVLLKNYVAILCNTKFMLNTLIFCATFLGAIAWIAAGPFLVITEFKYSTLAFGIFQALIFGNLILGAQVVKHTIDRRGPDRLINIGLIIVLCSGVLALLLTIIFPHFLFGLIISLMMFMFGSSLAFGPATRIAIEACKEPMGARMAIFSTLMGLFGVIGGLLASFTYTGTLLWFGVLLFVISCLACLARWWVEVIKARE
ncbi:MAG: Bcr/CflA family efflux MFS transporter [Gammaproteobacteria bacterium]|nr:MAG: Bcr/CflA family efflux MFS transporter [Gammaproteobacteria bacterium]